MGLYEDNGKENGNYYLGFRVDIVSLKQIEYGFGYIIIQYVLLASGLRLQVFLVLRVKV